MVATIQADCEPCIDRTAYTLRAILHGTSDDNYWVKLAASARQSALDMRVNLELELYPPGGYNDQQMASDIRKAADGGSPDDGTVINALIVTIPSETVAKAVRYASQRGMPVFGLNSGYEEVSGRGGLIEEGHVLFFTAMNERLAGEMAAEYFLREFGFGDMNIGHGADLPSQLPSSELETIAVNSSSTQPTSNSITSPPSSISWETMSGSDTQNDNATVTMIESAIIAHGSRNDGTEAPSSVESATNGTEPTRNLKELHTYTHALFISPLGETNSAWQQRHDGYRDTLIEASNITTTTNSNNTHTIINVDWYELDTSTKDSLEQGLSDIMSGCKYQSVLVSSGKLATQVHDAIEANKCHTLTPTPTKMGTFDTSEAIFNLVSSQRIEFAIDQHNHMQGWSPVHLAALYVSTGLVLSPPPGGVYLSGPALFTKDDFITDTLRICTDEVFPICPNIYGPTGEISNCPCTDRAKIRIAGVVHGITTDAFWDMVFDAAEQGAEDMGVDLDFVRFEPQESNEILFRRMSAKILSLCQGGVDGLFVSIPDPLIAQAVQICTELDVPVMSINAGLDTSAELNLIHHVGMVEENAGYAAGFKMVAMATFDKALCLNHVLGLKVTDDRCLGFKNAMEELGIEYVGEVGVPDDNIVRHNSQVERAVGESGSWDGYGFMLTGTSQIPAAMELKKNHPGAVMASFDTGTLLFEELENGNLLFGIDQQSYLQGYLPIPILTHAATTKQFFLNHAIESGPSFVTSSPGSAEVACLFDAYPVCPEHPTENYNTVNGGLKALGLTFFAMQATAAVLCIAWMIRYRKSVVIRASQPEFLSLVAMGCTMVASAILPLTIEGEYRWERNAITLEETDVPNESIKGVDVACMAVPWLICIGFVLIYSALVAKLHRIAEIMKRSMNFRQVEVPRKNTAITVCLLLVVMCVILITWTLVSPLRWEREVTETDYVTGYPTESIGQCKSEHFAAFAGTCAGFIALCLAYALMISYKTRGMPVEFAESKYMAASIFFLLQLLVLGVPILVIASDNRNAYYMVLSLILFLMSFGTTLLIFVPKILAHRRRSGRLESLMMSMARSMQRVPSHPDSVENIRRRTANGTTELETLEEEIGGIQPTSPDANGGRRSSSFLRSLRDPVP